DLNLITLNNGKVKVESTDDVMKVMHTISQTANYEVEIELNLEGDIKAGLLLFYRDHAYIGIQLDGENAERIGSHIAFQSPRVSGKEIKFLKLRVYDYDLTMLTSEDGVNWNTYPNSSNVESFQHNILGKFSSLKPALYWRGKGSVKFDNFVFKPLD
ncbi:hypothetical protein KY321_00940, partial [Candidatus Woesearchaeota archaeon]|nr:hypothetical protein [Candidatus Woesearchaeota archaeon]